MFNVCPDCGMYSIDKKIIEQSKTTALAECPKCAYQHPFLRMPLFILTGASGAGKTAVSMELLPQTQKIVVMEADILWCEEFNNPDDGYRTFRDMWLRVCKNISQAGKPVLLSGAGIPAEYEECPERRYFSRIYYMALVCSDQELRHRLKRRPGWRNSSQHLEEHLEFNRWLKTRSSSSHRPIKLHDTTKETCAETAVAVLKWITENLESN